MDSETRFKLIAGIAQEVVTHDELRQLVETNAHPLAYDGFEPSGLAHLPIGVYRPLLLKQLLAAGVKFKLLLADSYAWINEKMGGDLDSIRLVAKYFLEVWRAAGVPVNDSNKIEVVWHKQLFDDPEYWKTVFLVAKHHTEARTKRAMTIAGRKVDEIKQVAQLFYPSMQTADVFFLAEDHKGIDITQLGLDQRKANMLARELAPKLGFRTPVAVHHRMLLGLDGMSSASAADEVHEAEKWEEHAIEFKMSKSKPQTCIFVHDSPSEVGKKIERAYCPAKVVEGNPVLEYAREIIFRSGNSFAIERPAKFGGELVFESYAELEKQFVEGKIHPLDLKKSVGRELNNLIDPIRSHFEENREAKQLLEKVRAMEVTR